MAGLLALALVACTPGLPPGPGPDKGSAQEAAAALAAAIGAGTLTGLSFANASGADANAAYASATKGLGSVKPSVTAGPVTLNGDTASAALSYSWPFGGGAPWSYGTTATLTKVDGHWSAAWAPSMVNSELTGTGRLTLQRRPSPRGDLLDDNGKPIMTLTPVRTFGIDKSVARKRSEASAAALAKAMKVDPKAYVATVKAAGPLAFVAALTYRIDDPDRPTLDVLNGIAGARVVDSRSMLAPTRDFARALLGTVGEATKEIVDASGGGVAAHDQTGLTGLQRRYDAQLRGTPALAVVLVSGDPASPGSSPGSSASSSPGSAASASASGSAHDKTLWTRPGTSGEPLKISLDKAEQLLAEHLLADLKPGSSLVAIRPSTQKILVAANGPGANGQATATTGQEPPGSTFKVVSSLALLRKGMKPTDQVSCPRSVTVDGRKFVNYSDYPRGGFGTITLAEAVANSCNTAFIGLRDKVTIADLRSAAQSLGIGKDYDVGFPSFFAAVPDDPTQTGKAAAMIGQGKVLASPMAMAQVAASVAAGHTVVASLVDGHQAKPSGKPLTSAEAVQLRKLMGGVVTGGSGRLLAGVATGAKTGTAEYGTATPPKKHAWMIVYGRDIAVAVYVADGASGSGTAGPILKSFLQQS